MSNISSSDRESKYESVSKNNKESKLQYIEYRWSVSGFDEVSTIHHSVCIRHSVPCWKTLTYG